MPRLACNRVKCIYYSPISRPLPVNYVKKRGECYKCHQKRRILRLRQRRKEGKARRREKRERGNAKEESTRTHVTPPSVPGGLTSVRGQGESPRKVQNQGNIYNRKTRTYRKAFNGIKGMSLNVVTLKGRREVIALTMFENKIDFAFLQETKHHGVEEGTLISLPGKNDYVFYGHGHTVDVDTGKKKANVGGVGFIVSHEVAQVVVETPDEVKRLCSNRLTALYLKTPIGTIVMVNVYAPTNAMNDRLSDNIRVKFNHQLRTLLSLISNDQVLIMAGDFNARVGMDYTREEGETINMNNKALRKSQGKGIVIGDHTDIKNPIANHNGQLLIDTCQDYGCSIASTCFSGCKETWCHRRTRKWAALDHVIVKQGDLHRVSYCKAQTHLDLASDHIPLVIILDLTIEIAKSEKNGKDREPKEPQIDRTALQIHGVELGEKMSSRLLERKEGLDKTPEAYLNCLYECFDELKGDERLYQKRRKESLVREWNIRRHEEFILLYKEIDTARISLRADNKNIDKVKRYNAARQKFNKLVKQCKSEQKQEETDKIMHLLYNSSREFHKAIKEFNGKKLFKPDKKGVMRMKDKEGIKQDTEEGVAKVWVDFCTELFNNMRVVDLECIEVELGKIWPFLGRVSEEDKENLGRKFESEEIEKSIKSMSNNKAGGIDGVSVEAVKYLCTDVLLEFITDLTNLCMEQRHVPDQLKISVIQLLHKKGPKDICDNYRTISLLPIINKIIIKAIMNRLSSYLENQSKFLLDNILSSSQVGFRPQKRREDAILALQQILDEFWYLGKPCYVMFIDLKKAFDYLSRELLEKILLLLGIPEQLVTFMLNFLFGATARVKMNGTILEAVIQLKEGLLQGSNASPLLFIIFFAALWRVIWGKLAEKGIKGLRYKVKIDGVWHERVVRGETLDEVAILELMFADDAAVVASSEDEMQIIATTIEEVCIMFGMLLAQLKTEIMLQQPSRGQRVRVPVIVNLKGEVYKVVDFFKYLGVIMSAHKRKEDNDNKVFDAYEADLQSRLMRSNQAFGMRRAFLTSWNFPLSVRVEQYLIYVLPILLQASCVRAFKEQHVDKMETQFVRHLKLMTDFHPTAMKSKWEIFTRCQVHSLHVVLARDRLVYIHKALRQHETSLNEYSIARFFLLDRVCEVPNRYNPGSPPFLVSISQFMRRTRGSSYQARVWKDLIDMQFIDQGLDSSDNTLTQTVYEKLESMVAIDIAAAEYNVRMRNKYLEGRDRRDQVDPDRLIIAREAITAAKTAAVLERKEDKKRKALEKERVALMKEQESVDREKRIQAKAGLRIIESKQRKFINQDHEESIEEDSVPTCPPTVTRSGRMSKPNSKYSF